MNCHILRLLHVDFSPFHLRAWYRKSKQERRWVELSGEMIQIKISHEKVYRLTGPRVVVRAFKKRRKWGVLEQRLKEIIAAVLFAALLLLLT